MCLDSASDLWPPGHFALGFFCFSDLAFGNEVFSLLMNVENLEMDNSLKWVLFIKESGQITSDTLWK